jgi:SAM-dependent methyltransferase
MESLAAADADRLATALMRLQYTVDGVTALLGQSAMAALARNETSPGRHALSRNHGVDTVPVRLFCLRDSVIGRDVSAAFGPENADLLLRSGILQAAGPQPDDVVRCVLDLHPYGDESHDWWVLADPVPGMDGAPAMLSDDHVLGVNEAATTLAGLTLRAPVHSALDVGTGSGIQALHLCQHADQVVGSDILPRALEMARWSATLNGVFRQVQFRLGNLLEPVSDEQFDLIVSNPPFVLSPGPGGWGAAAATSLTYRDSSLPGDALVGGLVRDLPRRLRPGGVAQLLGNWAHVRGQSWVDRVQGWLRDADVDAWMVQREVMDPAAYVEVWLADAGLRGRPDYVDRYDAWLTWFEQAAIEAVGLGWVFLRRTPDGTPGRTRFDEVHGPVDQPFAPMVQRFLDGTRHLRAYPVLGESRLIMAPELISEQWSRPGRTDPEHLLLRQQALARRAVEVDTALAGFVGACDGELTAGQIADALVRLLHVPATGEAEFVQDLLGRAADLVTSGLLLPAR